MLPVFLLLVLITSNKCSIILLVQNNNWVFFLLKNGSLRMSLTLFQHTEIPISPQRLSAPSFPFLTRTPSWSSWSCWSPADSLCLHLSRLSSTWRASSWCCWPPSSGESAGPSLRSSCRKRSWVGLESFSVWNYCVFSFGGGLRHCWILKTQSQLSLFDILFFFRSSESHRYHVPPPASHVSWTFPPFSLQWRWV